jgi:hypothetical protein
MSDFMNRVAPPAPRAFPADEPVCAFQHPDGRVLRFTSRTSDYGVELRHYLNDQFRGGRLYRPHEIAQVRPDLDNRIAELKKSGWTPVDGPLQTPE